MIRKKMTQKEEKNESLKTDTDVTIVERDIRTVCNCISYIQKEKWVCENLKGPNKTSRDENYNL